MTPALGGGEAWKHLPGDEPIKGAQEDTLDRRKTAQEIAEACVGRVGNEGRTIAVTGERGIGKTSCLNMAAEELRKQGVVVVQFEGWEWIGYGCAGMAILGALAEQAATLGGGARRRARKLAWAVPALSSRAVRVREAWGRDEEKPHKLQARKEAVKQDLCKGGKQFVLMLDDLDRLDPEECRDALRTTKTIGRLPNVVYVLGMDKKKVEEMTGQGYEFLGKVAEFEIPVPPMDAQEREERARDLLDKHCPGLMKRLGAGGQGWEGSVRPCGTTCCASCCARCGTSSGSRCA